MSWRVSDHWGFCPAVSVLQQSNSLCLALQKKKAGPVDAYRLVLKALATYQVLFCLMLMPLLSAHADGLYFNAKAIKLPLRCAPKVFSNHNTAHQPCCDHAGSRDGRTEVSQE